MANERDLICKYDSIKVDTGVKKSNRVKIKGWSKSGTYEKKSKKMDNGSINQHGQENCDIDELQES